MFNTEQIKEISERMKGLREIHDLSRETLAKELNMDIELYEKYEEATCDIPVGFLYEFAKHLKVDLTTLLTGGEPKLQVYEVVRQGEGLQIDRRKQYDYQHLAYNFVNKKLEPFMVTVPVSNDTDPVSQSAHEGHEFNYVLDGSLKIVINRHEIILNEGDSIYFNAKHQHGMKALNGKTAKFLAIISQ